MIRAAIDHALPHLTKSHPPHMTYAYAVDAIAIP